MTTVTHDQKQTPKAWNSVAAGFDRFTTPLTMPLAEEGLRRVGLRAGERLLDVASGSGAISIPAARQGGQVTAVDFSPIMVERLTARAQKEGLVNLEARVMDGLALELEDNSFDISGSQNGVTLFPDLKRGLREITRVTRPGGRVLLIAFGALPKAEFISFFVGAMKASVPEFTGLPADTPPLSFQVSDPEKMREEMAEAGLQDIRVEPFSWGMAFQSGIHCWNVVTSSNPIAARWAAGLTEKQKADVQQVLDGMLRERSGGGPGAVLHNEMNIGIGRK